MTDKPGFLRQIPEPGARVRVVRCPEEPRLLEQVGTVLRMEGPMLRIRLDSGRIDGFPSGEALVYLPEVENFHD